MSNAGLKVTSGVERFFRDSDPFDLPWCSAREVGFSVFPSRMDHAINFPGGYQGKLLKTPYFRHYDIDLGSSFGRITSVLPTILKLSVRY